MLQQGLKLFYRRGLNFLQHNKYSMKQAYLSSQQIHYMSVYQTQYREFTAAKRGRKKKQSDNEQSDVDVQEEEKEEPLQQEVEEKVVQQTPPHQEQQEELNLSKKLFEPFSVGDIRQIDSTPDHKPPSKEDTMAGRYAQVLFTAASQSGALFAVFEDMKFLSELYNHSETFKMFTENASVGQKEVEIFKVAIQEIAQIDPVTIRIIDLLGENKRFMFVKDIADKYMKLYQQFNKEEKITIISATKLDQSQQDEVLKALKTNPQNAGKEFVLEFSVDEKILGGLQMYTESEFMDMSLQSRLDKLSQEIQKLID